MEKNSTSLSQEGRNDLRQYACLRKYEKIVKEFDEMMEMVDAVTKPPKHRRRTSNSKRNKSTSVADASNSASATFEETPNTKCISAPANDITSNAEAVETEGSKVALLSKAEKFEALEQIITKHLNDLQTDCSWELTKDLDN